jgi:hypothetical protein
MREEDQIQRAIIDYIRAAAPSVFVYAIPNAAVRQRDRGAGNAVAGLLCGVPDLGLILPGGRAGFIEVKSRNGRLSYGQQERSIEITACGGQWWLARSIDDVREALDAWGVPTCEACTPSRPSAEAGAP